MVEEVGVGVLAEWGGSGWHCCGQTSGGGTSQQRNARVPVRGEEGCLGMARLSADVGGHAGGDAVTSRLLILSVVPSSCWRSGMVARTGIGRAGGLKRSTQDQEKRDSPIHTKNYGLLVVVADFSDPQNLTR